MIHTAFTTRGSLVASLALGSAVFAAVPGAAEVVTGPVGSDETTCDLDGDGFDDLAVGGPGPVGSGVTVHADGAVHVLFGSVVGPTAEGNQSWDQDTPGIVGAAQARDHFGSALACGDFDGDGFDDLAVGIPDENRGGNTDSGAVQVLFGSGVGLTAEGNQFWDQDTPGVVGAGQANDHFGSSLASGDFDGDGFDDLAVGVPHENRGGSRDSGAVQVLFGSGVGLTAEGNQFWDQDTPGVVGVGEDDDQFGSSLASGDFDGDGFDDLAVGVPHEDPYGDDGAKRDAGEVRVLFGSGVGLTAEGNQTWHQGKPGIMGGRERDDEFASALTSGDFDGDGFDDLAVGVPHEGNGGSRDSGAVQVLFGSGVGLTAEGNQFLHQGTPGIPGRSEDDDQFGSSLASGDFDGDGFDDLAVGVPGEDPYGDAGAKKDAGEARVLFGSGVGLTAEGNQLWHQGKPGIMGGRERDDEFASALASGDFDGDGFDDLAVGVPYEGIAGTDRAGAAQVLFGSGVGPSAERNQFWHRDTPGILGDGQVFGWFGYALSGR